MLKLSAKYFSLLFLAVTCHSNTDAKLSEHDITPEQAVDSLDKYLAMQDRFLVQKLKDIKSIEDSLENVSATDSASFLLTLGDRYRRYNVDSAADAYTRAASAAKKYGDTEIETEATLAICEVNPLRGIVKESIELFENINPEEFNDRLRIKYFDTGFNLYLVSSLYYPDHALATQYLKKAKQYSDSLVAILPANSDYKLYHKGWSANKTGNVATALSELNTALDHSTIGDSLYARITAAIADCYEQNLNDNSNAAKYLALSAISDIISGTQETTSLQRLGLHLFEQGDLEKAYKYVITALHNSIASGSKVRALSDIDTVPIVSNAYRQHDKQLIRWLFLGSTVLIVASICLLLLLLAHRKSLKQLASYRKQQLYDSKLKDRYITHLLELCSTYIERLGDLNKLMLRKLKAGQNADLLNLAESGDFIKEQNDRFLKSFDETFLENYPNFIESLNELLKPDERFNPDTKRLTPELRIAALMRLGIDDGTKISHFLGLSLNTIYTYRNKLKNRSIDRNNFDNNILNKA